MKYVGKNMAVPGRDRNKAGWRRLAVACLAAWLGFLPGAASAQDVKPTPEQLRMLQQLPPSQREALLEQVLGQQAASEARQTEELEFPDLQTRPEEDEEAAAPLEAEEDIRIQGGETLVIDLQLKSLLTRQEREEILADPVLSRLVGSRHFTLSKSGILELPGLVRIPMLGLNADEATRRIGAEPMLASMDPEVTILQLAPTGVHSLEPFGYDLFEGVPTTFAPATDVPVPQDYVMGPGDWINVQLYGKENAVYELQVSRDGQINLPQLGPIPVAGLGFSEVRADLAGRVQEMLIGTRVSVSMGELRSIRVYVLGDVQRPGSYTVSGLSSMTHALFLSGGVSTRGSLRGIQLKRDGNVVGRLDLYELLLNGDTSGDRRLQPGDVVFVPPVGMSVSVTGAVRRPAIYELRGPADTAAVLSLAGGPLPTGWIHGARLHRLNGDGLRTVKGLDLTGPGKLVVLQNGDVLEVPEVLGEYREAVTLSGHVRQPGVFAWHPGMRLSELINSPVALKDGADLNYLLVRRELKPDLRIQAVSASLLAALAEPGSDQDIELLPRDTVYVFATEFGRQRIVEPLLDELRRQSRRGQDFSEVTVGGQVRAPGAFPLEPGMRISDLVRAGGDLTEQAFASHAELTRYTVVGGIRRDIRIVEVDLQGALRGDLEADLPLQAHDHLIIKGIPEWDASWVVELEGEFRFPGEYPIRRGESLSSVIQRAGGLTDLAFPEGAIFLREELKEREREQLDVLARRLEGDLAALSLQSVDGGQAEALTVGQNLLNQLRAAEPVGRLVIDLKGLQEAGRLALLQDIAMEDGDRVLIPRRAQEITVLGEVQYATSHIFEPGLSRDDYIAKSGGLTRKADKDLIYVVRASGAVVAGKSSRWFGDSSDLEIRPGDSIVVPLDADRIRPLTFWGSVTQILYQGALAVAAVKTFNN